MPHNRSLTAFRARWGLLLLAFALILPGMPGRATLSAEAPPTQSEDPPAVIELPPEAFAAPTTQTTRPRRQAGTKLESSLADQILALQTSKSNVQDVWPESRIRQAEIHLHAQITLDPSALETIAEAIVKAGGEVTGTSTDKTRIQCWLPLSAISRIAELPGVHMIRRPDRAVLLDSGLGTGTTTEALEAMNAPAWHAAGQIGAGVKVGVIDTGFVGYASLLGTDLPATVEARNFVDGENPIDVRGTTEHGTACAEIIYDVAPGISLYLAKVSTEIDLQEAVDWLKSQNVDIISTSLTWYNVTPGDGTGTFADVVSGARKQGILWVTAAGNDRENHWGGAFTDTTANDIHEFNGKEVNCFGPGRNECYEIGSGEILRIFVRWDDWDQVVQDFDLYLVRWNGTVWQTISSSTDPQEGMPGQRPTEYAAALTSGAPATYGFYIRRFDSTRDVNLEIFAPKARGLNERLSARSLGNLADVPDAITVAALDVDAPFPQEAYSAEGPTNGRGGTATGGFAKPDLAAYANVSVQGYGFRGFDGTSAATPHVAGAAALVLGLNPNYSPDQVQAFLEAQAIDMGVPGRDTLYGYGRLYLGEYSPAPVVTSITPSAGVYTGTVRVTSLRGENFKTGATVHLAKSNHPSIPGTNVAWVNETTLSLNLNLAGAANGSWDVVVTNPDGKTGTLEAGFTVFATETAPRVVSISPTLSSAKIIQATVVGQGFVNNGARPTVKLTQVGQAPIVATNVSVVDSAVLNCQFNLIGAAGGKWNVVVTNPDGAHWTLSEAFTVVYLVHMPYVIKDYPPLPDPPDPLFATNDTMVVEQSPLVNYDRDADMWVGRDHDGCHVPPVPGSGEGIGRALVKFDTSTLQPGTPILQATLRLNLGYSCDIEGRSRKVTIHRATSFWSSETVDWTTQPTIGEEISSQTIPPQETQPWGEYEFDVTELVNGWVHGDYLNQGIVILGPEGSGSDGARLGFWTSDFMGGDYTPEIVFSYPARADDGVQENGLPSQRSPVEPGCLSETPVQPTSGDSLRQLTGAGLCLAD